MPMRQGPLLSELAGIPKEQEQQAINASLAARNRNQSRVSAERIRQLARQSVSESFVSEPSTSPATIASGTADSSGWVTVQASPAGYSTVQLLCKVKPTADDDEMTLNIRASAGSVEIEVADISDPELDVRGNNMIVIFDLYVPNGTLQYNAAVIHGSPEWSIKRIGYR